MQCLADTVVATEPNLQMFDCFCLVQECGKPELVINVPIEEADILLKEVGRRANAHMEWIATVNAHLE